MLHAGLEHEQADLAILYLRHHVTLNSSVPSRQIGGVVKEANALIDIELLISAT